MKFAVSAGRAFAGGGGVGAVVIDPAAFVDKKEGEDGLLLC